MSETSELRTDYADVEVWSGHSSRDDPGTVTLDIHEDYGHVGGSPGQASARLTAEQARHLAVLLLNAADKVDPQAVVATAVDVTFDGSSVSVTPAPGAHVPTTGHGNS